MNMFLFTSGFICNCVAGTLFYEGWLALRKDEYSTVLERENIKTGSVKSTRIRAGIPTLVSGVLLLVLGIVLVNIA